MVTEPRHDGQKQKSKPKRSNQPSSSPVSQDTVQVNAAIASQQDLAEWAAAAKRSAHEAHTIKLQCFRGLSSSHGGQRRRSTRPQAVAQPPPAYNSEQHRTVLAEASAKLSSDKLRGPVHEALTKVVSASAVRHLELGVKLSFKLYEQLGTVLVTNSSLEVLSLAGSCCGDQALAAILPALTSHPKLQVLELPGCALTDTSAPRLATLLKAQAAAAAQQAWVAGLRGEGGNSSSRKKRPGAASDGASDTSQGIRVLDLSQNQFTSEALQALASALAEERSSLMHLGLAGNQLPAAATSAATFLQALLLDPPDRNFTVDLRGNFGGDLGGNLAGTADAAPTVPELGVWAGMFSWDASKGLAVAGAAGAAVQQRFSHHGSGSKPPASAGSSAPPALVRQTAEGHEQQQQHVVLGDSPANSHHQQQQQHQIAEMHLQQQQMGPAPQQNAQQQQLQEHITVQVAAYEASTQHTNGHQFQHHSTGEAARLQQQHHQQQQEVQSPASFAASGMDEESPSGPKAQGHLSEQHRDGWPPAAASPFKAQNHSRCSSPSLKLGHDGQTPAPAAAAAAAAVAMQSEGLLHVIMQQQQMLEMLVHQQEFLQQQQQKQLPQGQQQGQYIQGPQQQQKPEDAVDEGLLMQLAVVLNGLSEDVDRLEQLCQKSALKTDQTAPAALTPPSAIAAAVHNGLAKQHMALLQDAPMQQTGCAHKHDLTEISDAAALVTRAVRHPGAAAAAAGKAAALSASPQQQHLQQESVTIGPVDDSTVRYPVSSPALAAQLGSIRIKHDEVPRPPKTSDVDWHILDAISKQLYELHGLS